jgi:2-polyprenyl-3-methyl-5-hydroxy-6-metoxy-1,4-benzoquinol methylase
MIPASGNHSANCDKPQQHFSENGLEMKSARTITYLSRPAEVSMADRWFEVAVIDHFWIRRRFEVFKRLAGRLVTTAHEIAEIGCGHGLLQSQVEKAYDREVTGFDLNEVALKQNLSERSAINCYDIYQKDRSLQGKFDLIFLFDVLEHITDQDGFLAALLFHLAPGGNVAVNVPAGIWAYSEYDMAAGHVRRYSIRSLQETAKRNYLRIKELTYWGLPLVPTLAVRKLWLMGKSDKDKIISTGFDSKTKMINSLLGMISRCEPIPQTLLGTSLMAILEADRDAG